MGMTIRELVTKLGFDVDMQTLKSFDNAIDDAKKNASALGKKMQEVGKNISDTGKKMTLFLTAPILGMGAAMVKAASDADETLSKFNVVFKGVRKEADLTAENLVKNFGLSRNQAKQFLGDTGDLLTGFGFTQESALDLSKQVNELAVDLASFTNYVGGTEGASKALTKALLGERETVKSLGIAILDKDVKERVAQMRARGITHETERQAKAYATLELALEQSKNAIGDFSRTSDQFANKWRVFLGRINDVAVGFGNIMLPAATKLLNKVMGFVDWLDDLSPRVKTFILIVMGIVAAIGPVLIILGTLISLIGSLIIKFVAIKAALIFFNTTMLGVVSTVGIFLAKIAVVVAAITAVGTAIWLLIDDFRHWIDGNESLIGEFLGSWVDFKHGIKTILSDIRETFSAFFDGDMNRFAEMMEMWADTIKIFFRSWADDIEMILGKGIADKLRRFGGWIVKFAEGVGEALGQIFSDPKGYLKEWKDVLSGFGSGLNPASPAGVSPGALGVSNRNQTVAVDSTVNLTLPDTTLEENRRILQNDAKKMVTDAWKETLNTPILANPVRE